MLCFFSKFGSRTIHLESPVVLAAKLFWNFGVKEIRSENISPSIPNEMNKNIVFQKAKNSAAAIKIEKG